MKNMKVMLNNHLLEQIMSGNETLVRLEEYPNLQETISANPAHGKDTRESTGMRWSALGKQQHYQQQPATLPQETGVESVYPASP